LILFSENAAVLGSTNRLPAAEREVYVNLRVCFDRLPI